MKRGLYGEQIYWLRVLIYMMKISKRLHNHWQSNLKSKLVSRTAIVMKGLSELKISRWNV